MAPTNTPLHLAVESGSTEQIQLLLDQGASLTTINDNGWTVLHLAVSVRDDTTVAEMLLAAGADANSEGLRYDVKPLHLAAEFNRPKHVALLLERGADWSALGTEFWWTPLHVACRKLHVEVVKVLLARGADPNAKQDDQDATPLHACARAKGEDNPDDDRHGQIIHLLIEAGANLSCRDFRNRRPIDDAISNSDVRPLRALLHYRSDT